MGIKGLPKLIKDIAGNYATKPYKFSKFRGMTVAVDASLIIHQTVIALRSSGKDMKNSKGEITSHLHGLFYKILIFLQNGMKPIFVFDGKAPNIKNKTLKRRLERKAQAEKNLEKLSDSEGEEYIKHFKQTFKPSKENIKEALILLDLMGIPYIIAPGEADVVCAWLSARYDASGKRYVKGVCSDDSDMLAFGAHYLFKDMLRFMSKDKEVQVISLHKALVKMNLTMDQFTDLCVLLGCDYCDNLKGIGPKTAYRHLRKFGSLENVLNFLSKKNKNSSDTDSSDGIDKTNEECLVDARNYFRNAIKKIDESDEFVLTDDNLNLRKFQYEELMDFMCVKHNFDVLRIQTGITRLEEYQKKMEVVRENKKIVHKILQPRSENYIFKALSDDDDIEFLSSSDDDKMPSKGVKAKKSMLKNLTKKIAMDSESDGSENSAHNSPDISLSDQKQ